MSEDSKPKSLTDDFEKLFDLMKEGASYLLHVYLYFMSKTFPLEFIENLFNHHKNSSSYDYSKEGKTFIYRFFNSIFEVEKHIVAMALQYAYSYIPLPFIKTIYENFCINNNLECTDVKLKKCKKALISSSKDPKKKHKKTQNTNEDNDLVSRPFPFIPKIPESKNDNAVSDPLGILSPQENPIPTGKRSRGNSESDERSPPVVVSSKKTKPIYSSAPSSNGGDATHLSNSIQKSFDSFPQSELQPHLMTIADGLPLERGSLPPITFSTEATPVDSKQMRGTDNSIRFSKDNNTISSTLPLSSTEDIEVPQTKIASSPVPPKMISSESDKKPSKIPIKLPPKTEYSLSSTQTKPVKSKSSKIQSSSEFPSEIATKKPTPNSQQKKKQPTSPKPTTKPPPKNDIFQLPSTPQMSGVTFPTKLKKEDQNLVSGSPSMNPLSSSVNTNEAIPNPFSDLTNIFNPPSTGIFDDNKNKASPKLEASIELQPTLPEVNSERSLGNGSSRTLVNISLLPSTTTASEVAPSEKPDGKNDSEKLNVSISESDSSLSNQISSVVGITPNTPTDSAKVFNPLGAFGNSLKTPTTKLDASVKKSSDSTTRSSELTPENNTSSPIIGNPLLPPTHQSSNMSLSKKLEKNEKLGKQDSPGSRSDSSDITAIPPTVKNVEAIPNPLSDLAKIFNPPSMGVSDNNTLFSNPFAPSTTSSANSLFSNSGLNSLFTFPSASATTSTSIPTAPNIFQTPSLKTTEKSGESVAPVSKNIPPSVDFGNSFEKTIEQNNKALQKNMEDFGKSIADVFSGGLNAPTAGPSANA